MKHCDSVKEVPPKESEQLIVVSLRKEIEKGWGGATSTRTVQDIVTAKRAVSKNSNLVLTYDN
jgi:hypothetical protein